MRSIEVAKLRLLTAPSKGIGHMEDAAPAMEIWNDGSPISGVATTSATVQYATTTLTFSINGAVDTRVGASNGLMLCSNASYNTAIEVERAVNKISGWHCRLLGVLGAQSLDAVMVDSGSALNCLSPRSAKVNIETSTAFIHSWCVTNASTPVNTPSGLNGTMKREAIYDECGAMNCLFQLEYDCTLGGTSSLKFYSINRVTETENLIGSLVPAATTVINLFDFKDAPLTAQPGEQLVIIHTDDTSLVWAYTDNSTSIINAKSI